MAAGFLCPTNLDSSPVQFLFSHNRKVGSILHVVRHLNWKKILLFGGKSCWPRFTQLCKSINTVTCRLQPNFWSNLLMGFSAGCIASLVGAGGGVLLTPLFVTFYGLDQRESQGTSLVAVSFSSLVASLTYLFGRKVLLLPSLFLAVTAIFSSRIGAKVTMKLENKMLRRYFGLLLVFLSLLVPIRHHLKFSFGRSSPLSTQNSYSFLSVVLYMFAGSIAGFLSGLLGIGGGIILVPFLAGVLAIPQHFAQGTALLGMLFPSFSGSYVHWSQQNVNRKLLPGVISGIILGSFVGSRNIPSITSIYSRCFVGNLALSVAEHVLRTVCCIIFFLIGFRFVTTSK